MIIVVCNSANRRTDAIASQSNQVRVNYSGWCLWEPFFPWAASHCAIDSTWFPFDEQHCGLIYESWKYRAGDVNITAHGAGIVFYDYSPNGLWEIIGKLKFTGGHF